MFLIQDFNSGQANVIEELLSLNNLSNTNLGDQETATITVEQLKINYTYSIKILLLSIFSTYIILSL
jgi:hypothetical protein